MKHIIKHEEIQPNEQKKTWLDGTTWILLSYPFHVIYDHSMSYLLLLDLYCKAQRQLYPKIQATSFVDGGSCILHCILPKSQYLSISTDTDTHMLSAKVRYGSGVPESLTFQLGAYQHPDKTTYKAKWTNNINWQKIYENDWCHFGTEKKLLKLLVFAVIEWYRIIKDIKKTHQTFAASNLELTITILEMDGFGMGFWVERDLSIHSGHHYLHHWDQIPKLRNSI